MRHNCVSFFLTGFATTLSFSYLHLIIVTTYKEYIWVLKSDLTHLISSFFTYFNFSYFITSKFQLYLCLKCIIVHTLSYNHFYLHTSLHPDFLASSIQSAFLYIYVKHNLIVKVNSHNSWVSSTKHVLSCSR